VRIRGLQNYVRRDSIDSDTLLTCGVGMDPVTLIVAVWLQGAQGIQVSDQNVRKNLSGAPTRR
jgi:hypothetical protein